MFLQCLIMIFLTLLVVDQWKPRRFVKLHQQLGNDWRYFPIVGNAMQFVGSNEDIMTKIMQMASQAYGRTHKAISVWLGNKMFVVISDGEQACAVLKSALDKKYIYKFTKPLIGNGHIFAPESLFGVNVNMQRQPDHPFFNAFTEIFKFLVARLYRPWLHLDAMYKLFPMYTRQMRTMKTIYEFIDDLIYNKKTELNDKNASTTSTSSFKSFLELTIENSNDIDKGYTHEELREEMIVVALAATDTSAVGICFTILMLALHTDVQDRVYREIQEILGDSDEPLKSSDLLKLKYTRAVIKETLRLYPPVPVITRHCTTDLELPSGIVLPKGCDVAINIWGIHRNPEHWGEDANDFNPDRFISGPTTPNAFVAFSHGVRNCIGQQYAMLSLTTILVTLLRRYRLIPAVDFKYDKNNPLRLLCECMLREVNDFPIQIVYRNK